MWKVFKLGEDFCFDKLIKSSLMEWCDEEIVNIIIKIKCNFVVKYLLLSEWWFRKEKKRKEGRKCLILSHSKTTNFPQHSTYN